MRIEYKRKVHVTRLDRGTGRGGRMTPYNDGDVVIIGVVKRVLSNCPIISTYWVLVYFWVFYKHYGLSKGFYCKRTMYTKRLTTKT